MGTGTSKLGRGASKTNVKSNNNVAETKSPDKKRIAVSAFKAPKAVAGKKGDIAENLNATAQLQREKFQQGLDAEPILRELVKLPDGEDMKDWLEINTIHFFNVSSVVYGSLASSCTEASCPEMNAGAKYQYFWNDANNKAEPQSVSAKQYMTYLFDWIEEQISNPAIFPVDDDGQYPPDFEDIVKNIFKRLFRMYAHVYYKHFDEVKEAGAESQLNSTFQHFAYFVLEYELVDQTELRPLKKLISKLVPGYAV